MLKKFFAILVVLVFVVLAVPFAFIWNVYSNLGDEGFYKGKLVDYGYDLLIEELPKNIKLEQFPSLKEDDFRSLLGKVFSKDDFSLLIDEFVGNLKNLKEENGELHLKIPLNILNKKDDLLAQELTNLLYEKLPACQAATTGECLPANLSKIDFQAQLKNELDRTVFANLPDDVVIAKFIPQQFNGDFLGAIRHGFGLFFLIGAALLGFLLVVLALIIWSPWKRVVVWEAGAFVLWFFAYFCVAGLLKLFGEASGIVGHFTDFDFAANQSVKFGLGFVDLVLDHGAFTVWVLIVGLVSVATWLVFNFWKAGQNKVELGPIKKHK